MFSAYYWYRETLNISPNVESPQEVNWTIGLTLNTNYLFYLQLPLTALCLILSWVLVYLAMVKGITESPKVVYVTALFPYLVLIIFFIRAVTLRGMEDGIAHLFTPKVGPDLQTFRPPESLVTSLFLFSSLCCWTPLSGWRRELRFSSPSAYLLAVSLPTAPTTLSTITVSGGLVRW